jgi:hypothetical protein
MIRVLPGENSTVIWGGSTCEIVMRGFCGPSFHTDRQ